MEPNTQPALIACSIRWTPPQPGNEHRKWYSKKSGLTTLGMPYSITATNGDLAQYFIARRVRSSAPDSPGVQDPTV